MTPDFELSPVSEARYEAVFTLHETLFRGHIEQIWGWHPAWQRQNFQRNWELCETRLIEVGGTPAGYIQTLQEPDHLLLKNLGLLPPFQRRGIGNKLIRDLQDRAAELRLPIRLSVFVTNPDAVCFYDRLGFVKEGRTNEFQHMRWDPFRNEPFLPQPD